MNKYLKTVAFLGLGLLILVIGIFVGDLITDKTLKQVTENKNTVVLEFPQPVAIPQNVFDTTKLISGTSVSVSYPKTGFYGFGASVSLAPGVNDNDIHSNPLGRLTISAGDSPSNLRSPNNLSVGVFGVEKGENLNSYINNLPNEAKNNGTRVKVNGHDFFVYKNVAGSSTDAWVGIAFGKNELVMVSFVFSLGSDALSNTVFRDSDQLFFQVLTHINFQ